MRIDQPDEAARVASVAVTKAYAAQHYQRILTLHNQIPYCSWEKNQLLAERDPQRQFEEKWNLSFAAESGGCIVGICFSFIDREYNLSGRKVPVHYIHRICVDERCRRRGIGSKLMESSISASDELGNESLLVVVQTPVMGENGLPNGSTVIRFYHSLSFRQVSRKEYHNRTDAVLLLDRRRYNLR